MYPVTIPAGGRIALMHTVAQRRFQSQPTPQNISAQFDRYTSRDWVRDLPGDIRRVIVNVPLAQVVQGFGDAGGALDLATLDVDAGALDVLAMGDATRVQGRRALQVLRSSAGTAAQRSSLMTSQRWLVAAIQAAAQRSSCAMVRS